MELQTSGLIQFMLDASWLNFKNKTFFKLFSKSYWFFFFLAKCRVSCLLQYVISMYLKTSYIVFKSSLNVLV